MRWLVRVGFAVVANAVALVLAALVLDGFELDAGSFVVAVVIFSLLSLVLRPLLGWIVVKRARPLLGIVGLVTTFGVLLITDLLSDGIQIEGAGTWILATVIVWLATMIYEFVGDRLVRAVVGPRGVAPA
jgi:uncharacterized membrane protein YvlD (DUF360 family)